MTYDAVGLCVAAAAYEEVCPSQTVHVDAFVNACRVYHRHMISATLDAVADSMPDQPDLADRLRALAARERGVS